MIYDINIKKNKSQKKVKNEKINNFVYYFNINFWVN